MPRADLRTLGRHYLHLTHGSQLGNLVHLMVSMLNDLSLHKAAHPKYTGKPSPSTMSYFGRDGNEAALLASVQSGLATNEAPQAMIGRRTAEERRAYLGCFYLTSMYVALTS